MDLGWVFDGIGTDAISVDQARRLDGTRFEHEVTGGVAAPFPVGLLPRQEVPGRLCGRTRSPRVARSFRARRRVWTQGTGPRHRPPQQHRERKGSSAAGQSRNYASPGWKRTIAAASTGFPHWPTTRTTASRPPGVHDLPVPSQRFEWAVAPPARLPKRASRRRAPSSSGMPTGCGATGCRNLRGPRHEQRLAEGGGRSGPLVRALRAQLTGPAGRGRAGGPHSARPQRGAAAAWRAPRKEPGRCARRGHLHELRWNMRRGCRPAPFRCVRDHALQHPAFTRLALDAQQSFPTTVKTSGELPGCSRAVPAEEDDLMRREFGWGCTGEPPTCSTTTCSWTGRMWGPGLPADDEKYQGGFKTPNSPAPPTAGCWP